MLLIYRFIFVLLHTASSISMAQECRLGNKDYKTALSSFGKLGSVLMIRAMSRSNRLYDAMEARCYDGEIRVLSETRPPKKRWFLLLFCLIPVYFFFCFMEEIFIHEFRYYFKSRKSIFFL